MIYERPFYVCFSNSNLRILVGMPIIAAWHNTAPAAFEVLVTDLHLHIWTHRFLLGQVPLSVWLNLDNLFAKMGLTSYSVAPLFSTYDVGEFNPVEGRVVSVCGALIILFPLIRVVLLHLNPPVCSVVLHCSGSQCAASQHLVKPCLKRCLRTSIGALQVRFKESSPSAKRLDFFVHF